MRCVVRRIVLGTVLGVAATTFVLVWLALVTARPGDAKLWPPAQGETSVEVYLVSHGYHAGLVLPTALASARAQWNRADKLAIVAEQFGAYPFIEIGWGEERFYASTPSAAQVNFGLAARALFLPGNASVLHVVGLHYAPNEVFRHADIVRVNLSEAGFAAMLGAIDATFFRAGDPPMPKVLGKGLYGPSLFYRADRSFHIFNVCNHWGADMLSAAGLPMTPVLDTVPAGLLLDLRWRSGLRVMPRLEGSRT